MQTYPPAAVRPASAINAQRTQPHTHYERRRPETTVLHLLVREHIDTFLSQVKTESGSALPHHVEKEFEDYLRCGVLARRRRAIPPQRGEGRALYRNSRNA